MSSKEVKSVNVNLASSIKQIKLGFCRRLTAANSSQQVYQQYQAD